MPLTDAAIRNAKPKVRPYRMFDSGGLYLEVAPSGGKWWRLKYRFDGKERRISLGIYPDVPLAGRKDLDPATGVETWIDGARDRRDRARRLLANGVDPSAHRREARATRIQQATNSFEAVAREWFAKHNPNWAPTHGDRILRRLERDVFPWLGGRPVSEISPRELLAVIRRVESRGAVETAHRALGNCSQVFRYAVASGLAERDPAADLRGALPPTKTTHFPAVTDTGALGSLLRALDGYQGTFVVGCALRLAPLVFVRPGELRKAEWADIDLVAREWRYTASKNGPAHIVPLARQASAILAELHPLTGQGRFVFPNARSASRPMSDNAVLAALRRSGIPKEEMTGHGFRATARTILDEVLGIRPDIIEHQLAHAVRDPLGRAYNRTAFLSERREMMQRWADYLDTLREGAEVVPVTA